MYTEDLVYGVGETWIQKPTIVDVDGTKYYKWDGLEVIECSKGFGVFPTKVLPAELAMPYGGVV